MEVALRGRIRFRCFGEALFRVAASRHFFPSKVRDFTVGIAFLALSNLCRGATKGGETLFIF